MPSFNSNQKASITQKKDVSEAFKCYKKASDQGNARGMNNCGLMYESGFESNPPDLEKASAMYRNSHKLGNLDATINLAFYYLNVSFILFIVRYSSHIFLFRNKILAARVSKALVRLY